MMDLLGSWWFWVGVLVIGGLVGLLFYLRSRPQDE